MAGGNPTDDSPRRKRRWLRFGLRSLFVLTALVCVGFGVWYWLVVKPYYDQMRALDRIRDGGRIGVYERMQPVEAGRFACLLGGKYLQTVAGVSIDSGVVTEEDLRHLRDLPDLWWVKLRATGTNDGVLRGLRGLPKLRGLVVEDANVSGAGFRHLPEVVAQLEYLQLRKTPIDDEGLRQLAGASNLKRLDLRETSITDAGLEHISRLSNLEWLCLDQTDITDAGLEHISRLSRLEDLSLEQTGVTGSGLEHFSRLASLEYLSLERTGITDAGCAYLMRLSSLKRLDLQNTAVSTACLQDLHMKLLDCHIMPASRIPRLHREQP